MSRASLAFSVAILTFYAVLPAMSSPRVLKIVLLASFLMSVAQGSISNICDATRHFENGKTTYAFCMGVKDGKVSFPEGKGCLGVEDCDYQATTVSVESEPHVKWSFSRSNVLLVLSHAKTSTTSKVGEVYKLPPNVAAIGWSSEARLTDKDGKIGVANVECFVVTPFGFTSPHQLNCTFNGFMADLYKDALFVTLVSTDVNDKLVAEHQLDSPVVLLGRGMSGWILVAVIIGGTFLLLLYLVLLAVIGYYFLKKKKPAAPVTPLVDDPPKKSGDNI